MKYSKLISLVLLCFCFSQAIAQKKKPTAQGNKLANQIQDVIAKTKAKAITLKKNPKVCDPKILLDKLKASDLFTDKKKLGFKMDTINRLLLNPKAELGIKYKIDPHQFIEAYTNTDNYSQFVRNAFSKTVKELDPKQEKLAQSYFDKLRKIENGNMDFGKRTFKKKECTYKVENWFEVDSWVSKMNKKKEWFSYLKGIMVIKVTINCECKGKTTQAVKNAIFEYRGQSTLELNLTKQNKANFKFNKTPESLLTLRQLYCCQKEDISYEDPMLENTNKEIGALPNQTIGGFIGAGFQENFDETTFCVGAEYLHKVTQIGNSPLMLGGSAHYQTTSFFEVNTSGLAIGPTAQLFTSITSSSSVYLVNGVSAQYAFGSQDGFGFESNFSGFNTLLNTGVHVPINNQLGVSLVVPVLSIQSTTFKPEGGEGSFTNSNTGVFLENRNAIKIGLRFGF